MKEEPTSIRAWEFTNTMHQEIFILLKEAICQHIPMARQTPNGWLKFNCPVCIKQGEPRPDTKARCGVRFEGNEQIGIHCFNCQFKTKWAVGQPLSKKLRFFLESCGADSSTIQKLYLTLLGAQNHDFEQKKIDTSWIKKSLPEDSLTLNTWYENGCRDKDFLSVYQYAIERGISELSDLYWTPNKFKGMNNRLIIPCYYNHTIFGFTARNIKEDGRVKYYSELPTNFVYNLDVARTNTRKFCILTDGVIDAMLIKGISILGSTCSEKHIEMINGLDKEIIFCPDRDNAGTKLIDIVIENGWSVSFPKWENDIHDVAAACNRYGRILTLKSLIASRESNPLKIKLKAKLNV